MIAIYTIVLLLLTGLIITYVYDYKSNYTNIIMIFSIIGIIFVILHFYNAMPITRTDIPQTSFTSLNDDHAHMVDALDKFHDLCVDHWHEENALYMLGKSNVLSGHRTDIDELWKEHNTEHINFIDRIKVMKNDLITHIEKYDIPHFHWGKNFNF